MGQHPPEFSQICGGQLGFSLSFYGICRAKGECSLFVQVFDCQRGEVLRAIYAHTTGAGVDCFKQPLRDTDRNRDRGARLGRRILFWHNPSLIIIGNLAIAF